MKRHFTTAVVFCLLALGLAASGVSAQMPTGPGAPVADTYVDQGVPDAPNDASYLQVASGGLCTLTNATATTFLRWDVSPWSGITLNSVQLTLTIALNQATTGLAQFTLFKVADDTWDETKMTFNGPTDDHPDYTSPPPFDATADAIETFTVPAADYSGSVVFQSANLVSYVYDQAGGDGKASFAVRMTACPGTGEAGAYVLFFDTENGSPALARAASSAPASPAEITIPYMAIAAPTAVQVRTFRAADPTVNWPLIAGLAALIMAGGVWVYRRRAATRA